MLNKGAESLPDKDAHAFKQLAKLHDAKNFKKGFKQAEELLKSHPDHGETWSMKALFETGLGEDAKALESAKAGLMKSKMKSMFCWHTMGTIYKQKKDYLEASKCFQNAVRFEPENLVLLKEIAAMQIQVRDHSAHVQTRYSILRVKPNMIQNWTSFTLAQHLKGDFGDALKALKSVDNLLKTTAEVRPVELSHYYLYRAVIHRDAGDFEAMHRELQSHRGSIKDEVGWHELALLSALRTGRAQEAAQYVEYLIGNFPENTEYMRQYGQVHGVGSQKELYRAVEAKFKSKIARVLGLSHTNDENEFRQEFARLIKPYYQKNLISLFAEIQVLYESDQVSNQWIASVFEEFHSSLEKGAYPDGDRAKSPSEYLWAMYMLAQHHSLTFSDLEKALELINRCVAHTNTVSEFYVVKADILYRMHNNIEALETINEARKTDLADRYMNNICVKYLMRCRKPILGEEMLRMFMRDEANVYELQNQWYIIEAGKSYLKQRNFEAGLRHLHFIQKQFLDMQASEYDFHYYCFRKWTLREYTELISFNDNIYADKKYLKAAAYAIRGLREYVFKLQQDQIQEAQKPPLTASEERTAKKKKNKKKKEPEVEELPPIELFRKKIDYYGKEYAETVKKSPLEEALVWAKNVASAKYQNKANVKENRLYGEANVEAISVFIHFDKPLLVLKCFKKLLRTRFDDFEIGIATVRVLSYFEKYLSSEGGNDLSKEILKEYLSEHFKDQTVKSYCAQAQKRWQSSSNHLRGLKLRELELALQIETERSSYVSLYREQMNACINGEMSSDNLQLSLHLAHQLEFYGELSEELKAQLHQAVGGRTSYFSDWVERVDKLPESTWTMWWLSDYDIQREELETAQQEAKGKDPK